MYETIRVELDLDSAEWQDVLRAIQQRKGFLLQERDFKEPGTLDSNLITTEINTLEHVETKILARLSMPRRVH